MTTWKTSDGTMINYEVHGDPTHELPLLLLPGLLGAIETQWRPFLPALTPYYQVIMVDLRGHGRSENRSHDLRPEQMVSDLGELLDHLGLNRVHVAGYNLGGLLGLMLYQADPRRVATLLESDLDPGRSYESVEISTRAGAYHFDRVLVTPDSLVGEYTVEVQRQSARDGVYFEDISRKRAVGRDEVLSLSTRQQDAERTLFFGIGVTAFGLLLNNLFDQSLGIGGGGGAAVKSDPNG